MNPGYSCGALPWIVKTHTLNDTLIASRCCEMPAKHLFFNRQHCMSSAAFSNSYAPGFTIYAPPPHSELRYTTHFSILPNRSTRIFIHLISVISNLSTLRCWSCFAKWKWTKSHWPGLEKLIQDSADWRHWKSQAKGPSRLSEIVDALFPKQPLSVISPGWQNKIGCRSAP